MERVNYSKEQLAEIIAGIRNNVDTKLFEGIELKPAQMKELRLGLQEGLDVSQYNYAFLPAENMHQIRLGKRNGIDVSLIELKQDQESFYTPEQVKEIRLGLEDKQDVMLYRNPEYSAAQMREIRLGQRDHVDASVYANPSFTENQMHKLRLELTFQKIMDRIKESLQNLYVSITNKIGLIVKEDNKILPDTEKLDIKDLDRIIEEKAYNILYKMFESMDQNPSLSMDNLNNDQKVEAMQVVMGVDDAVTQYIANEFGNDISKDTPANQQESVESYDAGEMELE